MAAPGILLSSLTWWKRIDECGWCSVNTPHIGCSWSHKFVEGLIIWFPESHAFSEVDSLLFEKVEANRGHLTSSKRDELTMVYLQTMRYSISPYACCARTLLVHFLGTSDCGTTHVCILPWMAASQHMHKRLMFCTHINASLPPETGAVTVHT